MDIKMVLALKEAGVDTDGALNRFCNNGALYEKFLLKFPDDKIFFNIYPAIYDKNWDEVLQLSHALKGISANLGMNRLYHACSSMVLSIRKEDFVKAAEDYTELASAYNQICSILAEYK